MFSVAYSCSMVFRALGLLSSALAKMQARLRGPGTGILRTGHGVGAHKLLPQRVVLRGVANLALGGAHVDDNLFGDRAVQDVRDHFHGSAHGNGHHNDIGPADAVLVGDHFVHQANGAGGLRSHGVPLHAQHFAGKAAPLEVQGHGAANQAQADDSYRKM